MSTFAIETYALTKDFGNVRAVDAIDLRVGLGEIYGFLGLNGAGKTTTIRALLDMIRPSAGDVKVLGQIVGPTGRVPWSKVGYLVESPSAYPELTVRENLEISRRLYHMTDVSAVTRSVEKLALGPYADRKAGTLSTGNLQRLGLARALLHEPEILILDEPTNGLDPAGVMEIRTLLESLAREKGVTIFMSSHILTEVDRLATRIGIIHKGRLIEELAAIQVEKLRAKHLEVKARDLEGAQLSLERAGYNFKTRDETILIEDKRAIEHPDSIAQLLVNAGTPPTHLAVEQQDLEEHFMHIISSQ
jgi:ABC-2 type transport system ATP-binding protein